jgi:N-acyl-D-amino-acid deacylase
MLARNFDWTFEMHQKPDYEPALSTSVSSRATARGVTPEDEAYDMLLEKGGHAMMWVAMANFPEGSLDDIHTILRNDNVVFGLGDGGAHYGMISDFSYSTHALTHWARDRVGKQMSPQEVIMRLTSKTANVVGLRDRGVLAPGLKADINIIDLENLTLHGPEILNDLPAAGRRLNQRATGYTATIVSGQVIAEKGEPTGVLPGRLVRGAQAISAVTQ